MCHLLDTRMPGKKTLAGKERVSDMYLGVPLGTQQLVNPYPLQRNPGGLEPERVLTPLSRGFILEKTYQKTLNTYASVSTQVFHSPVLIHLTYTPYLSAYVSTSREAL